MLCRGKRVSLWDSISNSEERATRTLRSRLAGSAGTNTSGGWRPVANQAMRPHC